MIMVFLYKLRVLENICLQVTEKSIVGQSKFRIF